MARNKREVAYHTTEKLNLPDGKPTTRRVTARTENQRLFLKEMIDKDLVFAIGSAGSGKTCLAVGTAVQMLDHGEISKITITRPALEAYEKIGYLPGNIDEKMLPFLLPIYDEFDNYIGADERKEWVAKGLIEVVPLAYMRGRNMKGFVILDEAQNCPAPQLKLFLTRFCKDAKIVITGDPNQSDLAESLQGDFMKVVNAMSMNPDIGIVYFNRSDIQRHPLVAWIEKAFEDMDKPRIYEEFAEINYYDEENY